MNLTNWKNPFGQAKMRSNQKKKNGTDMGYDREKTIDFIEHLQNFFTDMFKLKSIPQIKSLPKQISKRQTIGSEDIVKQFVIRQKSKPVYYSITNTRDVQAMFTKVLSLANKMKQDIGSFLQLYQHETDDRDSLYTTLKMFNSMIERFVRICAIRIEAEDFSNSEDLQNDLYKFFWKLLQEDFIERVIPPITEGMKNGNSEVYLQLLKPINTFLSELGVYTMEVTENQKIDFDYCTPIESDTNWTNDPTKMEKIKEIKQLPYLFDEKHVISVGRAVVWRLAK